MTAIQGSIFRPTFADAGTYVAHVRCCLERGRRPWEPATIAELKAVVNEFHDEASRWLPSSRELSAMGLSPYFGRQAPAWGEAAQERLLATVEADPDFASAMRNLLLEGVT